MREVLAGVSVPKGIPEGLASTAIAGLDYDSRRVERDFLFFAFPGLRADGRQFARQAIERGALAVISESPRPEDFDAPWLEVNHGRQALALSARNLYQAAAESLALTGITGTNGKTTTSYLVDSVLRAAGSTTGLVGTIEYHLAGRVLPAVNTTPESLDLYRMMEQLRREGGRHLTMEVSSHALALGRVHGVRFHTAVFTNLTRDHLDFHDTMEAYFAAKQALFDGQDAPPPKFAILNGDDSWARRLRTDPSTQVLWYGLTGDTDLRAGLVKPGFSGLDFELTWSGQRFPLHSPLLGRINVYNILAAFGVGVSYGVDPAVILRGIEACASVPGRFERVDQGQPFLVAVDYAHTDDALRNAIAAARALEPRRVITVFGCGGDRDRTKRPLMGAAAGQASDFVVLTSDNPRSEDPLAIINDALVGLGRYDTPHKLEPDRERAIRLALEEAREGDLVLIAGKGHEPYQVLKDRTVAFDDREVARRLLGDLGYTGRPS